MNEKGIRLTGCAGKNAWKKKAIQEKKALLQLKFNFCRLNESWLLYFNGMQPFARATQATENFSAEQPCV